MDSSPAIATENEPGRVRAFVGFAPSPEAGEALRRRLESRREAWGDVRVDWVSPECFHATLVFLGPLTGEQLAAAQKLMRATARTLRPVPVALGRCACYPPRGRPRVAVAELRDDSRGLAAARAAFVRAFAPLGYAPDHPVFRPHVTLGRFRAGEAGVLPEPVVPDGDCPPWTVDRISLYVGTQADGALRYAPVDTRVLGGR